MVCGVIPFNSVDEICSEEGELDFSQEQYHELTPSYKMASECQDIIKQCLQVDTENHVVSTDCQDLIKQCLQVDPENRVDLYNIIYHPWLNATFYS